MQPAEVFQVVHDIMQQVQCDGVSDDEPAIVPEKKLLFNDLALDISETHPQRFPERKSGGEFAS